LALTLPGGAVRHNSSRLTAADLRASGARYQTLADHSPSGVILLAGRSLQILDRKTAAASKLTGYSHQELLRMRVIALAPEPRRAGAAASFAASTNDASDHGSDAQLQAKDGSIVHLDVHHRRLEDGPILSVWHDTRGQVQAEGHLRQLLSGIQLFAATLDAGDKISYANPALSRLTGWSAEELIGRSVYELLPPGTKGEEAVELGRRLRSASLQNPMFTEIVNQSGGHRWLAVSATLLGDESGLKDELRERSGMAPAIGRLQPGGTTEATARAICRELRGLMAVDLSIVAAVAAFGSEGGATILATDAPENLRLSAGYRLPSSRSAYLMERASLGPWAERWHERPEDGPYGAAMTASGVRSFSYAPIRFGYTTLGVLAVSAVGQGLSDAHLPAMTEFGSAASALLALHRQAERLTSHRRAEIESVMERHAYFPVFQPIPQASSGQVRG
jgi:PAS domain S-box-containing protein